MAWNDAGLSNIPNPIIRFKEKLKATAKALQSWSAKNFGDIKEQIVWVKTIIGLID